MKFSIDTLNKEQQSAVTTTESPLLLLAGAGSGKTRVITHRIAYLILEKQIPPFQILALTFTNKAAKEMKDRTVQLLGDKGKRIQVSTFHALCVLILRRYIYLLGYSKNFIIFDTSAQQETWKRIIQESEFDSESINDKASFFLTMQAKNNGLKPKDFLAQSSNPEKYQLGVLYAAYQKAMKDCNAVDFEDILYLTYQLFEEFPEETKNLKSQYQYIMVDEYQDTNRIQYKLIKLLSETYKKLCVVGDDDQSIYGWRGADIRNILDFQKDFPDAVTIRLEQNYRSTSTILEAANQVIANNKTRMPKKLWTRKDTDEAIQWINEVNASEEAYEILEAMRLFKLKYNKDWSDFAFLYRSHYQSRNIEEALRNQNIPYQMIGSLKFFDRKEIRSCLHYMYFLHNPDDDTSFHKVINFPKRGIGLSSIAKISQAHMDTDLSLFETLQLDETLDSLPPTAKRSCKSFIETIKYYHEALKTKNFAEVFEDLFNYINLRAEFERTEKNPDILEVRVTNYHEFLQTLSLYSQRETKNTLTDFLDYIALFTDTDELEKNSNKISLMTVHAAKGLEFDCVSIVNLVEDSFPSRRSMEEEGGLEEERRLFYVAITRAKEKLILSMPKTRFMYGEWVYNQPSCFLDEIQPDLFDTPPYAQDDYSKEQEQQDKDNFFSQWRKD